MKNFTLTEVAEDIYEIMNSIESCLDNDSDKFLKEKIDEIKFDSYQKKYNLPQTDLVQIIKNNDYDYFMGIYIINTHLIHEITNKYTNSILDGTEPVDNYVISRNCTCQLEYLTTVPFISNHSKGLHKFTSNCDNIDEKAFSFDPKEFLNGLKKTERNSLEMQNILVKNRIELIKILNNSKFLELLFNEPGFVYNEMVDFIKILTYSVQGKSIFCSDDLALFIYWLNQYNSFCMNAKIAYTPTPIERDILSNRSKSKDPKYKDLYKKLFQVNEKEYQSKLYNFIKLNTLIRDISEVKNACTNLLLSIEADTHNNSHIYLTGDDKNTLLYYENKNTGIETSFILNTKRVNKRLVDDLLTNPGDTVRNKSLVKKD